jgi:hypothetical protein
MSRSSIAPRDLAALILAATCWGVGTVISKAALAEISPFTLLPIQLAASLALLAVLMRYQGISFRTEGSPLLGRLGLLNPGLAYALGLIGLWTRRDPAALGLADRETYRHLTMVRRVRNLFAHTNGYLSFESQKVHDLLAKERLKEAPTTIEEFIAIAQAIEVSLTNAAGIPCSGVVGMLDADR